MQELFCYKTMFSQVLTSIQDKVIRKEEAKKVEAEIALKKNS